MGENIANVSFSTVGNQKIGVAFENGWGMLPVHEKEITVLVDPNSIEEISSASKFTFYPNPFVEKLNIVFGVEGTYEVKTFNAVGQLINNTAYQVAQGETKQLAFGQGKGNFFVTILKDGRLVKSLKVTKQ